MSFSVNKKRQETMLQRIGEASELVDNISYLPWFRSVQIKLEKMGKAEEWGRMIEAAKSNAKESPGKYFAELCNRVLKGTYQFVEKVAEIASSLKLLISDKLVKYRYGKYQNYWVHKANEFINKNSMAAFIELTEFGERKGISAQYMAKALLNCKPPRTYYQENVMGAK